MDESSFYRKARIGSLQSLQLNNFLYFKLVTKIQIFGFVIGETFLTETLIKRMNFDNIRINITLIESFSNQNNFSI